MDQNYMFYREVTPAEEIAHLVWSFWEFSVRDDAPAPLAHEVFPDGCVSLFYFRNEKFEYDGLAFNSLSLETFVTEVQPGNLYWGMRLAPAACAEILRCDPAKFTGPLDIVPHLTGGFWEKFNACADFDRAIAVFRELLKSLAIPRERLDERAAEAARLIEAAGGEIKIADLAKTLGLSARQLERRFRKATGLTPKQFTRARRIRAAAVSVVENSGLSWANRAAEMGFTDQSHLNHEFVSLTGRSPNSFAEKVSKIEHGKLV